MLGGKEMPLAEWQEIRDEVYQAKKQLQFFVGERLFARKQNSSSHQYAMRVRSLAQSAANHQKKYEEVGHGFTVYKSPLVALTVYGERDNV